MDNSTSNFITLFLCGDVMTGRGIDQVLPHSSNPVLHESYIKDARDYVTLAENTNGIIEKPVNFAYIWGDALEEFERVSPDLRLINLETSITKSDEYWQDKLIHYRMQPDNSPCLTAAHIDYCSLANNHVIDWGYAGLQETLDTLTKLNIKSAGAGHNLKAAAAPTVMEIEGKGRVIVFSWGFKTSGIPRSWAATDDKPGVNRLTDVSDRTILEIKENIRYVKRPRDIVVASIHWGGNWGYQVPGEQRAFAHKLIDQAGVDIIHGHSSHHVKGIEVYREKLILYGCGDLLTDYEGISGYEQYRDDLNLMYFVTVNPATGQLINLQMTPTQIKNMRLNRASATDTLWLRDVLNREGKKFRDRATLNPDNTLTLHWE
ncbi:MAG: CapA family protein [Coleofasciculus sp. B1-GNL1-01]|uniref:CapA family protein n=1 Tax=Coleofasciculus sp. B1-GNL1-01 TaxID=3068484 RepID=UPI003300C85D